MKAPGNFCRDLSTGSFHWLHGSHSRTRIECSLAILARGGAVQLQ
jgi:hypothetical protein